MGIIEGEDGCQGDLKHFLGDGTGDCCVQGHDSQRIRKIGSAPHIRRPISANYRFIKRFGNCYTRDCPEKVRERINELKER